MLVLAQIAPTPTQIRLPILRRRRVLPPMQQPYATAAAGPFYQRCVKRDKWERWGRWRATRRLQAVRLR